MKWAMADFIYPLIYHQTAPRPCRAEAGSLTHAGLRPSGARRALLLPPSGGAPRHHRG